VESVECPLKKQGKLVKRHAYGLAAVSSNKPNEFFQTYIFATLVIWSYLATIIVEAPRARVIA
jgi:hypothetical protein